MKSKVEDVLKEALTMPSAERAALAAQLISSLDPQADQDVEALWQAEAGRRLREARNGAVELESWEAVRDRLKGAVDASG